MSIMTSLWCAKPHNTQRVNHKTDNLMSSTVCNIDFRTEWAFLGMNIADEMPTRCRSCSVDRHRTLITSPGLCINIRHRGNPVCFIARKAGSWTSPSGYESDNSLAYEPTYLATNRQPYQWDRTYMQGIGRVMNECGYGCSQDKNLPIHDDGIP